jgi:beta-lactamase superfamily II metal-dependent hydrolase
MTSGYIAVDLVKVYKSKEKKPTNLLTVLAWGDPVEVMETDSDGAIKIRLQDFNEGPDGSVLPAEKTGFILAGKKKNIIKPIEEKNVLQVSFVDVQQGDGCVIETPGGKIMLIDGGENQMFARYLAARYQGSSPENPRIIDCILVTHGDADHFTGLPKILDSETNANPRKRIFIRPERVYHNGIVKGPSKDTEGESVKATGMFGKTTTKDGKTYVTELHDDLLKVPDTKMNKPFRDWKKALTEYADFYGDIICKRLDQHTTGAFDFLDSVEMEVLGPIVETVNGKPALKFLRTPPKSVAKSITDSDSGSPSASHTINGHSVILRMKYGNVRFFFAGDLNEEAEHLLVEHAKSGEQDIQSEILKVPHHGSGDFSNDFLAAIKPMVSIVSSGDESEIKEYIHPRATLVGALGKHSSIDRPLVFVTEMVAFLKKEGWVKPVDPKSKTGQFFGFSRSAFGIVHVRTDGKRVLVFTHSGKRDMKEAYAYVIENEGDAPQRADVVQA